MAAVTGGEIIDLVYFEDVLPDFDAEEGDGIHDAINDARIAPTVRSLSALGEVFVGMCSCWEFVVL